MKFLHTGDLHLESPFKNIKDTAKAKLRKAELNTCLLSMIEYAQKEEVDLFLIAGDLFEGDLMNISLFHAILQKMEQAQEILFFISPGNHDYFHEQSLYYLETMPKNVKVFSKEIEKVYVEALDVNVYGCGFVRRYVEHSLLLGFVAEKDKRNVMVLHGDLAQGVHYNPITKDEIAASGLDYLALGHVHKYSGIQKAGDTLYAYSGNPMGRGFDECNEKGFIVGEVKKGVVDARFVPLEGRKYMIEPMDISHCTMIEEVVALIKSKVGEIGAEHLIRICLTGKRTELWSVDVELMKNMLPSTYFYIEIEDETQSAVDYKAIGAELSLRGVFVREMMKKMEQAKSKEEQEACKLALAIGYENLS